MPDAGLRRSASPTSDEGAPEARFREAVTRRSGVTYLLALAVLFLFVAIGSAAVTIQQVARDTDLVEHTLMVEATTNRVAALNEQIETGRRGFIIDGSPNFHRIVEDASRDLLKATADLSELVSDNAAQQRRAEEIALLTRERSRSVEAMFASGDIPDYQSRRLLNADRNTFIVRRIRALAANMIETEAALLKDRNRAQFRSLVQLYVVGGAALALLIVILAAVIAIMLRYNRSLSMAQRLLRRANEGLEDAVARRTAELQRANQEIQRFAYIVSHDLRSPLVNVLGFTSELDAARKTMQRYLSDMTERQPELVDEEVRLAVEEDLPEALGFIRTSTEKMDRLINSILDLSRQGRRALAPEMLELDEVAAAVIANLHQRAVDAGATVEAGPLPALESDRLALEQILSNLVENAIKYLSPSRPGEVRIEGARAGPVVHIDVIDNGRGISPEDHERIFDLFRRSGQQDRPGEGIGLANVRALAYRLGGTIAVESELDRGARFRLSLPAKFVEAEQP